MKSWRDTFSSTYYVLTKFRASPYVILMLMASLCEGGIRIPISQMRKLRIREVKPSPKFTQKDAELECDLWKGQ